MPWAVPRALGDAGLWVKRMKILREIITFDNLLHTILGFVFMAALWGLSGGGSFSTVDWPLFARIAALWLYLREVGQVQARYHHHNFLRGWTLRGTDPDRAFHRHMEWIVPSVVVNGVTIFFQSAVWS